MPLAPATTKVVAIAGLFVLTLINVAGVKAGAVFSDIFTALKIAGLFGLVIVGLTLGSLRGTGEPAPSW